MSSSRLSRMLAALRRYMGRPADDRDPAEMIEEFKAAAGNTVSPTPRSKPAEEDRPTLH